MKLPDDALATGAQLHGFAEELFPICRSLTGAGVRQTLEFIAAALAESGGHLQLHEVPSGTPAFDWAVPDEWNVREAYLVGPDGERVVDFADHNLHLVGYSEPVRCELDLEELQPHLHSLPEMPEAIPYVTSYYARRWGFCMTHHQREALAPGRYRVVIDTTLEPGHLTYGECVLPGESDEEVLLSTYVCHPSMANNELSGPLVTLAIARWLAQREHRLSYRFYFGPETIGAIVYLSRTLELLRESVVAGYVLTCIGDDRAYSFLPTKHGDTLSDRAARHVLQHLGTESVEYDFLVRASDERQYQSALVNLPIASLMRTKYGEFPEYHTSADDLSLVTPEGLAGGFELVRRCIEALEANVTPRAVVPCEPQLGRRGLYSTLSSRGSAVSSRLIRNVLTFADGDHDLLAMADRFGLPIAEVASIANILRDADLLRF